MFRTETVDFLDWAESYLNQLDPLHVASRTGEFEKNSSGHYLSDLDRMKEAFGRLLGSDWADAWKVGHDYTPKLKAERRYYYGDKSVFEIGSTDTDDDPDA